MANERMNRWSQLIRRWWFWCLAGIAAMACLILAIRFASDIAWWREKAAARAAGRGATFADLVGQAPAVDDQRQALLFALSARIHAAPWSQRCPRAIPELLSRPLAPSTTAAAVSPGDMAARDKDLAELGSLLDGGPLVWGMPGWIKHDFPRPGQATVAQASSLRSASLYTCVLAADEYAEQALHGDQSGLRRLDELLGAVDHACSTSDQLLARAVAPLRDLAYLDGICHGTVPSSRVVAWLAEASPMPSIAASALDGERLCYFATLAEHGLDRGALRALSYGDWGTSAAAVVDAMLMPKLCALWSMRLRAIAAAFRGEAPRPRWAAGGRVPGSSWMARWASTITRSSNSRSTASRKPIVTAWRGPWAA